MEGFRSFILPLILISAVLVKYSAAKTTNLSAHVGTTVALPCELDLKKCGLLHSVKWYKESIRVYVLSHAGLGRSEEERMNVEYKGSGEAFLKISPVEANDEATYKCEITYLDVVENCDVVQIVKLRTLKMPESVKILLGDDKVSISNATIIGPKEEGDEVDLTCEAAGGKPIPEVKWFNGTSEVTTADYTISQGTASSKLRLTLTRGDLLARFECRVMSIALTDPIISWVTIDVEVRPTKIKLSGVNNHVVQGTNVMLTCDVFGARPAATVRWMNGSIPITNETLLHISPEDNNRLSTYRKEERDGTYTTKSSLIFKASHFENGQIFYCYAENDVMEKNAEPELHESLILDVRHPPVITVSPLNTTVNETTILTGNGTSVLLNCQYFANPQELNGIYWSKDGRNLTLTDTSKYVGGTVKNPPLYVNNITRDDMGEYACSLRNEVGSETSSSSIFLNVQFSPNVEVVMEPSTPIRAVDRSNVLLECNITTGNPSALLKVRWFLDGQLMKEFPECNYTNYDENGIGEGSGGPFCGLDPSILSLERVDETFSGNYTCQGKNVAGWGPVSEPQELIVYYPPSPAKLRFSPSQVVKGALVTLDCTVDSEGRPDNVTYIWFRGSHHMTEITSSKYIIQSARLETRSNFTCIAENEGGQSDPATIFINVNAPPTFIHRPLPYQGVLYSSHNINLTCVVECYPECSIVWKKDGVLLDTANNPLYYIETKKLPPDVRKNDFESINSTLIWNMTAWPGQKLNKTAPVTNYTCQSKANSIGLGVSSTTVIAVDFPPEELTVSPKVVHVVEHRSPSSVKCHGNGHPTLRYRWKKGTEVISSTEDLALGEMVRSDTGAYICEGYNKHGIESANVYFNVQYAPECRIATTEKDSNPALVCTVDANPQEVTFQWRVKEANETFAVTSSIIQEGLRSYLILDSSVDMSRTYYCSANNSVGVSVACEKDVSGNLPWWKQLKQEKIIVIIASIIAIIIIVIIICIIIIMLCRRKRADTKSPNPSSIEDKARLGAVPPVGGTADPLSDPDKGFYENLPFHGMQNPPNKPYRPDPCDLDYADVDYKSYGPINYKAASIYAAMKRNKNNNKMGELNKDDLL